MIWLKAGGDRSWRIALSEVDRVANNRRSTMPKHRQLALEVDFIWKLSTGQWTTVCLMGIQSLWALDVTNDVKFLGKVLWAVSYYRSFTVAIDGVVIWRAYFFWQICVFFMCQLFIGIRLKSDNFCGISRWRIILLYILYIFKDLSDNFNSLFYNAIVSQVMPTLVIFSR